MFRLRGFLALLLVLDSVILHLAGLLLPHHCSDGGHLLSMKCEASILNLAAGNRHSKQRRWRRRDDEVISFWLRNWRRHSERVDEINWFNWFNLLNRLNPIELSDGCRRHCSSPITARHCLHYSVHLAIVLFLICANKRLVVIVNTCWQRQKRRWVDTTSVKRPSSVRDYFTCKGFQGRNRTVCDFLLNMIFKQIK